ncbi:MAG: hypothetical protein ACREM8_00805, partial [Vulcanimicrobiaceae bacterium]
PSPTPTPIPIVLHFVQELTTSDAPNNTEPYTFDVAYDSSAVPSNSTLSSQIAPRHEALSIGASQCQIVTKVDGKRAAFAYHTTVSCPSGVLIRTVSYTIKEFDPNRQGTPTTQFSPPSFSCNRVSSCTTDTRSFSLPSSNAAVYELVTAVDFPNVFFILSVTGINTQFLPYNDALIPYPIVYPDGWITGGFTVKVPFPDNGSFSFCPEHYRGDPTHPECPKRSKPELFRKRTIEAYIAAGFVVPAGVTVKSAGGYQDHHIKPVACGGDSLGTNGVFLTPVVHEEFNRWWDHFNLCATRRSRLPVGD